VNGRVTVDPAFETALDYISDRQRSSELITMSFAELRHCLDLFVRTRVRRTETGWKTELSDGRAGSDHRPHDGRPSERHDGVRFTLSQGTTGRLPVTVD